MARLRIAGPARDDLAKILATSRERWGDRGHDRYFALLVRAFRSVVREPFGSSTRQREDLLSGMRSLHTKYVRQDLGVRQPVHIVFFRPVVEVVEIVRVLHERMDPTIHIVER